MKRLAILLVALIATSPAWSQKEDAMGNTKVNTDFSKYKTFTWAKSDPHMVGPEGYEIYYYEITPDRAGNRTDDMNRYNREMDKTEDMNRNKDLDKTYDKDQTQRDQTQRDQSYNRRDTSDLNRTEREREASDRATDKTYQDPNKDKSTDPNQTYNRDTERTDDMSRRPETYSNENKPSGYVYSYTMIIPARDPQANQAIQDGISNELEGRGFREGGSEADLIVAYQVLDQKATLHGFTNDDPTKVTGGQEVRQPSDTATFALEPGTLIVSLIDSKTSEMVWHGWSSGLIENRGFQTDEAQLKEAIHTIFEEFKHKADAAKKN